MASILMVIAGTLFLGIVINSGEYESGIGMEIIFVLPLLAYIGSALWFKSWYDFDRKPKRKAIFNFKKKYKLIADTE